MFKILASLFIIFLTFSSSEKPDSEFSKIPDIIEETIPSVFPALSEELFITIKSDHPQEENENDHHPNTEKIPAYNTKSEKDIEKVAAVAVEKSPVLISATPTPTFIQEPPKGIPLPTIKPSPIPIKPPIPIDPPKPTIIPIPEPTKVPPMPTITITPVPIKPPIPLPDPCYCPPDQYCLMIACPEIK